MPDQSPSLAIELGKIRWVRDYVFGVEFIRLPIRAHQQLDQVIWTRFLRSLGRPTLS